MKKEFILMLIVLFACSQDMSYPILVDGQIGTMEWGGADQIVIDNNNKLYVKGDKFYYYLAIKSDLQKPLYVDLFVEINDTTYNFHASSQLGDRVLTDTLWTDSTPPTLWGRNHKWIANTVKFDRSRMKELRDSNYKGDEYQASCIPYDGFEFQLDKSCWDLRNSKLRMEIRPMIESTYSSIIYPHKSVRMNSENWAIIFD